MKSARPIILLVGAGLLCACGTTGAPQRAAAPVQTAPLAYADPVMEPAFVPAMTASLWTNSPQSLFGDRRARGPGDILTVKIDIDDRAEMRASVATDRQANEGFSVSNLFGLKGVIEDILPNDATLDPAVGLNRTSNVDGSGRLRRGETLSLTLAAQVAEITPNGDLVIIGRQNVQVEGEARTLFVSGIVRREDISRRNIVTLDKIANAQVGYDGSGAVARTTRDRAGTRILDKVIPF
ncbi:flagellar basal body L-ring protein FlgH [uncultured Algimonas sp.]|uniref:flagellar basal body L-ring protein FlgH n=1 Tax=uncultured Algimonas sp. TaxID=1547920 RepID=UPI002602588F|nr:flagellar basal body L-ring protein FlgH [uncultured Algimonas sp.]